MMAEHGKPCEAQEATYCMNGATCYKITSVNALSCRCTENYKGSRCELLQLSSRFLNDQDTGLLAAAIIVAILILVVLGFVIYYTYKMVKTNKKIKNQEYQNVKSKA
uniref:Neuregulin 4 n=2 Tax=Kryptolebias marmoratus TaxID=37003 RepID=A0A3Q3BF21_KRYMA